MATNWKKVLFEGANIEIGAINSNDVPEILEADFNATDFEVVTGRTGSNFATDNLFRFSKVNQNTLNNVAGGTTFTVSGSTGEDAFDANGNNLQFTTINTSYLTVDIDGSNSGITTASINPVAGYVTESGQLNIINYSLDPQSTDPNRGIGWDTFYTDFYVNGIDANSGSISDNRNYVSFDERLAPGNVGTYTTADGTLASPNDGTYGPINLHSNQLVEGPTPNASPVPLNVSVNGRRTIRFLSASFVGGFILDNFGGTAVADPIQTSLEDSYTAFGQATHSINIQTESFDNANTELSANSLTWATSNNSFLVTSSVVSKKVLNPLTGLLQDQITVTQTTNSDLTPTDADINSQGIQLGLGNADGDLIISGTLTGQSYHLSGDGLILQQIGVETFGPDVPGYSDGDFIGTQFGVTGSDADGPTIDHSFTGIVSLTGSLDFDTTLKMTTDPGEINAATTDVRAFALIGNGFARFARVGPGATAEDNTRSVISGSALGVSSSIALEIASINTSLQSATDDVDAIAALTGGYSDNADSLETTYQKGFFIGTSSTQTQFLDPDSNPNVTGFTLGLQNFLYFRDNTTDDSGIDDVLTFTTQSEGVDTDIRLELRNDRLVAAANILTSESQIYAQIPGFDAAGEGINTTYVSSSFTVLTGSNADNAATADPPFNFTASYLDSDILNISNLASSLPDANANDFFITGAGSFSDLDDTPGLGNVVDETSSPTQGVLNFLLDDDNDPGTAAIFKFGATGSQMAIDGNVTFAGLTVDGNFTVEGNLINKSVNNINVADQFMMVNSGAKQNGAAPADADKDGGIIVDEGNDSGSLFIYSYSQKAWGFRGAATSNKVALDAISADGGDDVTIEAYVRPILYFDTANPTHADLPTSIPYGDSTQATDVGVMCISSNVDDTVGDVWINVG